jgi:hypothetical protein
VVPRLEPFEDQVSDRVPCKSNRRVHNSRRRDGTSRVLWLERECAGLR